MSGSSRVGGFSAPSVPCHGMYERQHLSHAQLRTLPLQELAMALSLEVVAKHAPM